MRLLALLLVMMVAPRAWAAPPACSLETQPGGVYVLTVQPGDGIPNAFGHTALLIWNPAAGKRSAVFDYGRYSAASFVELATKMMTMTLPYYMAAEPVGNVINRYTYENREVVAQRLALEPSEIRALVDSQREQTKDPMFPYNWYEPNCTTKVRDAIDHAMGGALQAQHQDVFDTSPCREVLRHAAPNVPLWFGIHWGSGRTADERITSWSAMFLPDGFRDGLNRSERDGTPFVSNECTLVSSTRTPVLEAAPSRNGTMWLLGLVFAGLLYAITRVGRGTGLVAIGGLGVVGAIFGSAAVLVGMLGTFAPFWGWHNLWFAHPGWVALPIGAWIAWRNPESDWPRRIALGLAAIAGLGVLAFLLRGLADRNFGIIGLLVPVLLVAAWQLQDRQRS